MILRYKLAAIKMVTPSKEHLEEHYKDLSDKPFFKGLVTCTFRLPLPLNKLLVVIYEIWRKIDWIQIC